MRVIRAILIALSVIAGIAIAASGVDLMDNHLTQYQQRAGLETVQTVQTVQTSQH